MIPLEDRKSTRLNSSHANISYAVFCLKKKTISMTRDSDNQGLSALTQGGREMSETATQRVGQNPLQDVSDQLGELRAKAMAPNLRVLEGEQKPVCVIDGREVINLASNNYLGLTTHKALRKAAIEAVRQYGAGGGAVRTIAGTMKRHMEIEGQIRRFRIV